MYEFGGNINIQPTAWSKHSYHSVGVKLGHVSSGVISYLHSGAVRIKCDTHVKSPTTVLLLTRGVISK